MIAKVIRISKTGFLLLALVFIPIACKVSGKAETNYEGERLLGISFVAANEQVTGDDIDPIISLGATWVSLMPYGFVRKAENIIHYNSPQQWWGETDDGLIETVRLAKQAGLRVMIKPQIWFRHGEYTGSFVPPDSAKTGFEESFADFVLHYAEIAQVVDADLFCIGTEWHKFIDSDPEFWQQLIAIVRKKYQGQLTYAANWDEYKTTPFWGQLDYLGVNAYFPLSEKDHPTIEDLQQGWQPWVKELMSVSAALSKPILFTEYGYRSTVNNASKPWESYTKPEVSLKNQKLAYRALYLELWDKPWFAGGFAWKWFHNHEQRGGEEHIGFSPQNKPVEKVIREYYSKK